jgi:serine/threonine protein kinase
MHDLMLIMCALCACPQVLRGESYTEKCDVWSFGVVMWEMLQRKRPYAELEMPPFLMMMSLGTGQLELEPIPDEVATPGLVELTGRCLDRDAASRPGFREVLHMLELEYRGVRSRMAAGEGQGLRVGSEPRMFLAFRCLCAPCVAALCVHTW